jgi:hypothetical protein
MSKILLLEQVHGQDIQYEHEGKISVGSGQTLKIILEIHNQFIFKLDQMQIH